MWRTGAAGGGRALSEWRREFEDTLPVATTTSPVGCISCYNVHSARRHTQAVPAARSLQQRGLRLIDFVPNHMALDHPRVEHPDYFVPGSEEDLQRAPEFNAGGSTPEDSRRPRSVFRRLARHAASTTAIRPPPPRARTPEDRRRCDGVRCDMAMLVLPEFERDVTPPARCPQAIDDVRRRVPGFTFMAEVYWDLEGRCSNGLRSPTTSAATVGCARAMASVREHFTRGSTSGQARAFLRITTSHARPPPFRRASRGAVTAFLSPGLRFFHQASSGASASPHLVRGPSNRSTSRRCGCSRCASLRDGRDGRWRCSNAASMGRQRRGRFLCGRQDCANS